MSNIIPEKRNSLAYIIPCVILVYTFTLVRGWVPQAHAIYVLTFGFAVSCVVCAKYFKSQQFIPLLLFEIILGLNLLMHNYLHAGTNGFLYEMMSISITAMVGFYYLRTHDGKLIRWTVVMLMFMLVVNAIGSAFVETIFPGSIRACITEFHITGTQELAMSFYKFGMANYDMTHAIPTIIPMLVFGIKTVRNIKLRVFFILVLASCLILCFLGGSTTVLIFGVLGLIVSLSTKSTQSKGQLYIYAVLSAIILLVFSNDTIMLSFLQKVDDLMGNEGPFHSKILDFQDSIVYGEISGSMDSRGSLYLMSVDAIISHPLFGTNSDIIGHHSTLLDHWACLGLIGFIPYLVFIFQQVKDSSFLIPDCSKIFYVEGIVIAVLMLAIKSVDGWESWLFLFVFLPLLARYIGQCQVIKNKHRKDIK